MDVYKEHDIGLEYRCVICGNPYGGFGFDGKFYCWNHLNKNEKIEY